MWVNPRQHAGELHSLFVLALNRKWIRLTMHGSVPKRVSVTIVTERRNKYLNIKP